MICLWLDSGWFRVCFKAWTRAKFRVWFRVGLELSLGLIRVGLGFGLGLVWRLLLG